MSDVLWNIPNTWIWTEIKDLGEIVSGGTPSTKEPAYWGDEVNWISPSDLTSYNKKTIAKGAKNLTLAGLKNSSARVMPAGSIHFSSRAPIGYVAISSQPICTNQGFKSLVPSDGVFNEYAYYYLQTSKYLAEERATGTTFKEISGTAFGKLPFPLPPINEQKRIVAKIEELFSKLECGIASLKTAREQLKVYRHCILDEAASGKILVSAGTAKALFSEKIYVPLSSVVSDLGQGWSPKCHEHPSPNEDVWGVIKTTAIQHLEFDGSENKELPAQLEPRKHLEIQTNDILITRAGPRNRVGVACLVKNVRKRLILCDKAYRLRVDETKIMPEYLVMLLNTPKIIYKIEEIKTGINDSGVNLTQNRFLELKLPVPSLETQRKILLELEAKLSNITYLEGQIESSLFQSEALRQSILKKAFSGRIVAQDPADEPAGLLLERIRRAKQKNKQPPKLHKRAV